jgi:hypothetical protein
MRRTVRGPSLRRSRRAARRRCLGRCDSSLRRGRIRSSRAPAPASAAGRAASGDVSAAVVRRRVRSEAGPRARADRALPAGAVERVRPLHCDSADGAPPPTHNHGTNRTHISPPPVRTRRTSLPRAGAPAFLQLPRCCRRRKRSSPAPVGAASRLSREPRPCLSPACTHLLTPAPRQALGLNLYLKSQGRERATSRAGGAGEAEGTSAARRPPPAARRALSPQGAPRHRKEIGAIGAASGRRPPHAGAGLRRWRGSGGGRDARSRLQGSQHYRGCVGPRGPACAAVRHQSAGQPGYRLGCAARAGAELNVLAGLLGIDAMQLVVARPRALHCAHGARPAGALPRGKWAAMREQKLRLQVGGAGREKQRLKGGGARQGATGADGFKLSILDDGGADAARGAGAGAEQAPAAAAEERLVATVHINRPAGRSKARLSPPIPHNPPPPLPCLTRCPRRLWARVSTLHARHARAARGQALDAVAADMDDLGCAGAGAGAPGEARARGAAGRLNPRWRLVVALLGLNGGAARRGQCRACCSWARGAPVSRCLSAWRGRERGGGGGRCGRR